MKKRTVSLALQIAQIIEDNSSNELREAVELLQKYGCGSDFLAYLYAKSYSEYHTDRTSRQSSKTKALHEITSRAVLNLKDKDPEKFRVLSEFDSMIRRGQILPNHEDLRRFGERLSKDFEPKNSRKDTISSLMNFLSNQPTHDIEELIKFAASFGVSGSTDEYQRLARFIIKGKEGD